MRIIRSKLDYVDTEYRVLAKLNGKTVGFIDKNLNGTYSYAFGRPKASYVAFNVDDLDTAKSRLEEHVFMGNSRRPIKSGWVFISSIGDASIFEENDKYLVTLERGANIVEEYFDDEASARDFAKEIASAFTKSSRRPIKSSIAEDIKALQHQMFIASYEDYQKCLRAAENDGVNVDNDISAEEWEFLLMTEPNLRYEIEKILGYPSWYVKSSRQIKSARYIATDPESGEVLGSADTYEEAINETRKGLPKEDLAEHLFEYG
jgi:hypothetical protein